MFNFSEEVTTFYYGLFNDRIAKVDLILSQVVGDPGVNKRCEGSRFNGCHVILFW